MFLLVLMFKERKEKGERGQGGEESERETLFSCLLNVCPD